LLDYAVNQRRDRIRDRLCQFCAPLRRIGLHAKYHNFARGVAQELERDHEIRESQLMDTRLSREALKRLPFEAKKRSSGFANVDCIDHQETPDAGDEVKQTEPLRAAIKQNNVRRDARIELKSADGVNSDTVVGMNQIAEAKDQRFRHR
jgi:hypothetical protein